MPEQSNSKGLTGLRVLSFESRRAGEMAKLISAYGGKPTVAPSMREVPLESNTEAIAFARTLASGGFDMIVFLTGVGTRALARVVETVYPLEQFAEALRRIAVVARGPKPVAALKELGVPVTLAAPEPNTWRDLLRALDENAGSLPLAGKRVAVQEYGISNPELLAGLAERGANVTRLPVYQWALPEDTGPLRAAVETIARGETDVVVFTTSIQIVHLLQIAREMGLEDAVRQGLARIVVGSIGPVTSEELREQGISPDFEPVHPKMGFLLNEAGQRGRELLEKKRREASG
ncbi:MAG: uroporphyrinogen-III synthase [Candidatus Acidiferrales bacterium]|jgi:uroporphyrinogen-III synthase